MLVEVAGGLLTGSLALLADAGHMLTDSVALVLAYIAYRMSERPGTSRMTYGFDRLKILVAYTNGLTVLGIAVWIMAEAAHRLMDLPPILGAPMLVIASLGLLVERRRFLRAERRRQGIAQSSRRDPARHRRPSRIGRGDRGCAHHPDDRLAAGRSAAFGAGGGHSRGQRLAADARVRTDPARGGAARMSIEMPSPAILRRIPKASPTSITCISGRSTDDS